MTMGTNNGEYSDWHCVPYHTSMTWRVRLTNRVESSETLVLISSCLISRVIMRCSSVLKMRGKDGSIIDTRLRQT